MRTLPIRFGVIYFVAAVMRCFISGPGDHTHASSPIGCLSRQEPRAVSKQMRNPFICSECVGDSYFLRWIAKNGRLDVCEINKAHVGKRNGVNASSLAIEIDNWFRENYVVGNYDHSFAADSDRMTFDQRGDPYADIMMEKLECEEEVFHAVEPHLPDVSDRDIAQGDESFYDDSNLYESLSSIREREEREEEQYWFENRIYLQWKDFCEAATHHKRFFGLKEQLDALFGDLSEFESGHICPIYSIDPGQQVYRARLIDSSELEAKLEKDPAGQLDAPPKDRTRPGRMNVEFIPAFYAAFSEETAIAEIRPGIGETVAIGKFLVARPVRVFDFTVFARITEDKWREVIAHTRYDFIYQMESEISKPIMPYDKQREYIPTQIVAEYIGECFKCEAVVYRSSMMKAHDKESRNIVFLNKGVSFQGQNASILEFKSYDLQEVADVQYTLVPHIPF